MGQIWPTGCSLPTPALNYHRRGFNFQLRALILNTVLHLIKWDIKSVNSSASINQHINYFQPSKEKCHSHTLVKCLIKSLLYKI